MHTQSPQTEKPWDVVVIGAGAAGLSAALLLGRARRRVLVIDSATPRNRFAAHVHGALGNEGVPPSELLLRGRRECEQYGVRFVDDEVERVEDAGVVLRVAGRGAEHRARAVVVATGLRDELPDVPGLRERWGTGVLHCPYCHGWEVRDSRLGLLLTSDVGVHLAGLLPQWSADVTVFGTVEDDAARARLRARGVRFVESPVRRVEGEEDRLDAVVTADGAHHRVDALFVSAAARPQDDFLVPLAPQRSGPPFEGFLLVDAAGRTSADRVWAAGNVVDPSANVVMSIGAGARVGGQVNAFLTEEDTDAALARVAESSGVDPATFWDGRYAGSEKVWSGSPNASVVAAAGSLPPGRALELGCGEGADAIWLASRGWRVTAIDISAVAVDRARRAASSAGVADRIEFAVRDLSTWEPDAEYDLVTTAFLHSPVDLDREPILRRACRAVAPGGHLLIVAHAAAPPWAEHGHDHSFPTPADEVAAIGASEPDGFAVVRAEVVSRPATAPDGAASTLDDVVVLVRRASLAGSGVAGDPANLRIR